MKVPSKIYRFLEHRQSHLSPKLIWIDGLCIDQDNLEERQEQVSLMKDVFGKAARVMVWLASPEKAHDATRVRNYFLWLRYIQTLGFDPEDTIFAGIPYDQTARALQSFLEQRWFRRVWMVQEVALAQQILLLYGSTCFAWWELDRFVSLVMEPRHLALHGPIMSDRSGSIIMKHTRSLGNIRTMSKFRGEVQSDKIFLKSEWRPLLDSGVVSLTAELREQLENYPLLALEEVLSTTVYFGATKAHDKIFAILGTIFDPASPPLMADYVSSFETVYLKAMKLLLSRGRANVISLSLAGIGLYKDGLPVALRNMPSWVPDYLSHMEIAGQIFRQHGPVMRVQLALDSNANTIKVQAFLIDYIASLGPACESASRNSEQRFEPELRLNNTSLKEEASWVLGTKIYVANEHQGPTELGQGESGFDEASFWRTIFADRFADETPIPAEAMAFIETEADQVCRRLIQDDSRNALSPLDTLDIYGSKITRLAYSLASSLGRRFAISEQGKYALVPPLTKIGDVICMFQGLAAPFLLRSVDGNQWQLVGACYVDRFENMIASREMRFEEVPII
jgi:hypothetical protein